MKKIKILWVITGGLRRNGICVSQLEYAKRINKNDFSLDIAAVHNNSEDMIKEYENAGCRVVELPDRRKKLFKYIKNLKKLILSEKYDIVHVFGSSSLMGIELYVAKKCNVKLRIAHSRNTTCDRKTLEKVLRPFFKKTYNYALACGKDAGDWLFDDNYEILHNGKDLESYKFNPKVRRIVRDKYKIEDKIAFGHVGNFNNQKNHDFLIDIFYEINKQNKNTLLFLMGSGDKMSDIQEKVKSLGLDDSVVFLGSINNVNEIIQGMDIMLFPSLFEGLPNVVIEWQASGVDCILSNTITKECSVSNLVNFVPIDEGTKVWTDIVEKIKPYSEEKRTKNSKDAINLLKENSFEIEANVIKLENLYKKILNDRVKI